MPDLAAVARAAGLSIDAAIGMHLQAEYVVRMYGFAPGYAYLSGVPAAIRCRASQRRCATFPRAAC